MTTPPQPSISGIGRFTGLVLSLIGVCCIALIGLSGYVKYELDRAETVLAAPEIQLSPEQQSIDKVRRDLGYGGFIGLAQSFASTHDAAVLPDMKAQLKLAHESLDRLPEKTAAETRHDLQAILANYQIVLDKAEKSTATGAPEFLSADITPLYTALSILDTRVTSALAANRGALQSQAQFWGLLLTFISWSSLIIAAALTVSIYLVLRDRNSAPMRALAQSVKNMARGDMRTSIWGMERQDAVGELARAVDMARFHFSQLPDMSLLSENGPVRIRFEGNTRSLFEAMMRVISRDSEQVHGQASSLTDAVGKQQEAMALLTERVEAVLQSVERRAVAGDVQVRQALHGMLGSAESLKNAQEHAADQLNRLIPFLQERTQGMAEITQIAGKQVTSALQSLSSSERGLRSSAEQSEAAIRKLSTTADTLGERMFGAVNLLQASGKVLAETTEKTQSRLEGAIERLNAVALPDASAFTALTAQPAAPQNLAQLDNAIKALETAQERMEKLLAEQTAATRAQIDLLTTQSGGLLTQSSTTAQTLTTAADRLRDEQARLGDMLTQFAAYASLASRPTTTSSNEAVPPLLLERLSELEQQVGRAVTTLAALPQAIADQTVPPSSIVKPLVTVIQDTSGAMAQSISGLYQQIAAHSLQPSAILTPLLEAMRDGSGSLTQSIAVLQGQIANLQASATGPQGPSAAAAVEEQLRDHWYQMAAQIEATRANLAQVVMQQADRIETHLASLPTTPPATVDTASADLVRDAQNQMEQQTLILNELVTTLSLLDAHMQELRSQVTASRQMAS